ncbi:MAG TPA: DinB family protein, partial [Pseudogracilibacillus sp.]|nr:DinB family protein [Pseudogracilibacillus sp.]
MEEIRSKSIAEHFQVLQKQREDFFEDEQVQFKDLWTRPLAEKWSVGESLYHLLLMLKVFRRFSVVYIPIMKPVAAMRKNKQYPTTIHDIYQAYTEKHQRGMSAPPFVKPPEKVRGTYTLEELQQMLRNETHKLMKMTSNIEEYTAGNIYYFDPMAGNPNLIQSIHLL